MNKKLIMLWTFLLCFVGGISAQGSEVFNKISSLAELTDGDYLIVGKDERAMGAINGKYYSAIVVTPNNGVISSVGDAVVWTIKNVDGKYIISSNGSYVASNGDANQAKVVTTEADASKHTVTVEDDGTFAFADNIASGRFLQYNSNSNQWRFAYYKGTQNDLMLYKIAAAAAVAKPVISGTNLFFGSTTVTLSCETADAKIYYTIDGSEPTAESTEYTAPFTLAQTATVKAIAIKGEDKSSVATADYTLLANIANTADDPMTVAEALEAISANNAATLAHEDNKVYVKGIINYIKEVSIQYGNATYSIVDKAGDTDTLLIYRGKFIDNAKFTAEDSAAFLVGKEVVIYGNLVDYKGTKEMAANNYLISLNEVVENKIPADGDYYLYEVSTKQFLTHGENWGTKACLDNYGTPVTWNSTEGSLKFMDNALYLFKTNDNQFFTDNNSTGFKFVEAEGGYYLQTGDGAYYMTLGDGALLKFLAPTENVAEAVVWQLKTKDEHDAIVAGYVNQNYENVIKAAGLGIEGSEFLTELAKYTAVDKTDAIGTARFAGNVGSWTYTQVRDQGGQPAYGTDFCELWQETGYHTQTITGLTPGIYKVTVQGFERAASPDPTIALGEKGYLISTSALHANTEQVALKAWYADKGDGKDPDNTAQAVAKFNEGKYLNEVYTYVGWDGTLNLMVDKHAHVGGNWVLFNNFTLTYYEEPPVTGAATYAIAEGETHPAGDTVDVKDAENNVIATLTFGFSGGADFKAGKANSSVEGFTALTDGNGENGKATSGTVYIINPIYDGTITVGVCLNAGKAFYVTENETALAGFDGIKVDEKYYGTYTFDVKGGSEYKVYCTGSKLGFYGFNYTYEIPGPTEVANIAALKDVEVGTEVKLALNNAVVNLWSGSGLAMSSYVEDATGAIVFDMGLSNMEWMSDSIAMNGYIYATYGKNYNGIPQLSVSESTGKSMVSTVSAVPTAKVMTVANANDESALSRYVKFENVEFVKKAIDDWTTGYYLVQGNDTITFFDQFYIFGYGSMPDFQSFTEVQGIISAYEGKMEFYPYGEFKANYVPAVVAENIAAAKKLENGTNVKLTLKDAKITAYVQSRWGGATIFVEDESGAIQLAEDVATTFGVEGDSTILNGTAYVKYVNEWGTIQFAAGDSLAYSDVTATPGVVKPTTKAIKEIKDSTNIARYIEIANPTFKYDEETYSYYAAQNGDTIKVVDNFGWMSSNFELNEETYTLIIPDSVESIKGIVMYDDWSGYSISPVGAEAIVTFIPAEDITVNVAEGEISAAVEAEKAKVAKVGNITVNLTEGASYTIANSIVAPAGLVINGNGATIDASALAGNMITTDAAESAEWVTIDSVAVTGVTIKGLKKALFYSAIKNRNIQNFVVDNSVVEIAGDVVTFDFTKGSVAMNFVVSNSTLYAPTATTKSLYSSQSAQKGSDAGATADAPQVFAFQNSTLYNLGYNKNLFTHRSASQTWIKYVIKDNVIVNTGKANFMTTINQGQDNKNPQYDVTTNSVGTLLDGVYTDLSASQLVQENVMGTLLTSDPMFKDAANGDFTLGAETEQNISQIGDPRWIYVAPAPSVAYLCGATETTEAIYTALVNAGYDVTPLNYDDVTLTEEIVANDFAGKYDVVVLAGNTGSGTNLAKSANQLLGNVNVLSTKSFWYKHYGTNGTNPGTADAPSRSIVMTDAEHPIFSGITATEAGEFEVFNDMGKETGRYLQGNGSFTEEAYAQTTLGTTNGTDCIGEAWIGNYGYVIIPVDGIQPAGYLTADGEKLFVNAVQYLLDGVKYVPDAIDGINANVNVMNGDVYSINGIKVRKAGESLNGLAKGMYIINGKKFIVK